MVDRTDLTSLILAGSFGAGAVVSGVLLRWLFTRLARRALHARRAQEQANGDQPIPRTWAELGWALLKGLAIPVGITAGLWGAAVPSPRRPAADSG